ncbi:hypothetical protein FIBSPDRAFT_896434 [Athelia psychrophila]|uniref:Uncharacterized protein n=1 Tax=Athelia psychrophila TaxID=1759441 RepID=A0A166DGN4_9AGAM|nr:hypothetical protein FIBSPDRAFT_896434 [Fibularhizoctonia sp. CBS 109695]
MHGGAAGELAKGGKTGGFRGPIAARLVHGNDAAATETTRDRIGGGNTTTRHFSLRPRMVLSSQSGLKVQATPLGSGSTITQHWVDKGLRTAAGHPPTATCSAPCGATPSARTMGYYGRNPPLTGQAAQQHLQNLHFRANPRNFGERTSWRAENKTLRKIPGEHRALTRIYEVIYWQCIRGEKTIVLKEFSKV